MKGVGTGKAVDTLRYMIDAQITAKISTKIPSSYNIHTHTPHMHHSASCHNSYLSEYFLPQDWENLVLHTRISMVIRIYKLNRPKPKEKRKHKTVQSESVRTSEFESTRDAKQRSQFTWIQSCHSAQLKTSSALVQAIEKQNKRN